MTGRRDVRLIVGAVGVSALGGVFVAVSGARATLALAGAIPLLTACIGLALYRRKSDRVDVVAVPVE